MSKQEKSETRKKGGSRLFIAMGAVALLAAGGGGAYAMMRGGLIPAHEAKDNTPRLIRKGDSDPYPAAEDTPAEVYGDGGSEYRTAYYSFADSFTSNLKGSDGLVQLSLAASTRRDGRVLMWMQQHELAIRSSILTVLADTGEDELGTIAGKQALRKRLTAAINDELVAHEGFGGVDQVYFRSFIVQ
ncbi:flagellar basal body-associated FliL family protein [Croceicoccus sp. Ery5]|jgi:flagellar protein FliL|uniref:flagellar basal body-associated FliL family protein n=1 Tax=Croceicoccus sp. Ery5 TaxID=1703340 RepID=UPI001E64A9FE|nr:flagellar basal body-associated FliL family protein [Croceicoccus sp. Ery5]